MQTTTALYVNLKLLLAQPEPSWGSLLKVSVDSSSYLESKSNHSCSMKYHYLVDMSIFFVYEVGMCPILYLQVLLMKDLTLPILILTQPNLNSALTSTESQKPLPTPSTPAQSPTHSTPTRNAAPTTPTRNPPTTPARNPAPDECGLAFCTTACQGLTSPLKAFLSVISRCNKPTALFEVLLPIINRSAFLRRYFIDLAWFFSSISRSIALFPA